MSIKPGKNGGWKVDIQPAGRGGQRVRKTFERKRDAEVFVIEQKAAASAGEWTPPEKDSRTLQELIDTWYELHGHALKDGKKRKGKLDSLCDRLGNPVARKFTGEDFLRYRKTRLETKVARREKLTSPNTLNHDHTYLSAVFNMLINLKNWNHKNPMQGIPKLGMDEPALIYLERDQIRVLLAALGESQNPDVKLVAKVCLSTGARWGEAETLRAEQVRNSKLHFVRTKNGKSRSIPISPEFEKELLQGRPRTGRLFQKSCHQAFAAAVERAGIVLPDGQMTHVLRHTFASHFMINDGNILKLKEILGHQTLMMTIRYAKLAPKHLTDAVTKNPLATLECQQSVNANER